MKIREEIEYEKPLLTEQNKTVLATIDALEKALQEEWWEVPQYPNEAYQFTK